MPKHYTFSIIGMHFSSILRQYEILTGQFVSAAFGALGSFLGSVTAGKNSVKYVGDSKCLYGEMAGTIL